MNDLAFALFFLHFLKGPPLSCLFAMVLNNQPVTIPWLIKITGYNRNSIKNSLIFLTQCGFVIQKDRYTWSLTEPIEYPMAIPGSFLINPN